MEHTARISIRTAIRWLLPAAITVILFGRSVAGVVGCLDKRSLCQRRLIRAKRDRVREGLHG